MVEWENCVGEPELCVCMMLFSLSGYWNKQQNTHTDGWGEKFLFLFEKNVAPYTHNTLNANRVIWILNGIEVAELSKPRNVSEEHTTEEWIIHSICNTHTHNTQHTHTHTHTRQDIYGSMSRTKCIANKHTHERNDNTEGRWNFDSSMFVYIAMNQAVMRSTSVDCSLFQYVTVGSTWNWLQLEY